ncbi:C40 family peptidase [Flammeovirga aprica]|uniref:C40 family peptidase n=1 Tax=Flammeovirga aprica JL-4 TaxID=694437 RepID=A0A7X9RZ89_9BACT|nr:C40 family peptidase [Flammeovirga aprica]NME71436.1 C40 family peptidase [Flammeovirga aprica JL-4]
MEQFNTVIMKYIFIFYFLLGFVLTSHAQSDKKLQKLLNKGKYDKVMAQGMKAHQKKYNEAYPFKYMSWACWFKAQSFPKFSDAQWKYLQRSIEHYIRYDKLKSTSEKPLATLEGKLTLFLTEFSKKALEDENDVLLSEINQLSKNVFALEINETTSDVKVGSVKEDKESFSPFSFTYQEGNYETFFKAENINIPPYLIAKKADDYIGVPYKYAKVNPYEGFDCSGFVLYVYKQFGVEFPHNTKRIAMLGKTITLENAQEGDIVCFGSNNSDDYQSISHLGMIYKVENDQVKMIHCGTSTGVIVAPLTDGYWKSRPFFIKRLLTLEQERMLR